MTDVLGYSEMDFLACFMGGWPMIVKISIYIFFCVVQTIHYYAMSPKNYV